MRLHDGEPTVTMGAPLAAANAAVVALHGRGAAAAGIAEFVASELGALAGRVTIAAPQARHSTWYPKSFLAPFEENQPWLDSALARVGEVVAELERAGVARTKIVLFGFSQGACLASEWLARGPRPIGGLVVATGGRIGPPGTAFPAAAAADALAGVSVHLSAGDPDAHVPWQRVEETAAYFRALGAGVVTHREPGYPHSVHPEASSALRRRVAELIST